MQANNYKFWAGLLDTFNYYLLSDNEEYSFYTAEKVIETINRTAEQNEAMKFGSEFHSLIGKGELQADILIQDKTVQAEIVNKFINIIGENPIIEYRASKQLINGVTIYGLADFINIQGYEIKTTSNYTFPKYINAMQHKVYAILTDIPLWTYLIYYFKDWCIEDYIVNIVEAEAELTELTSRLIDFIEANKEQINFKYITI